MQVYTCIGMNVYRLFPLSGLTGHPRRSSDWSAWEPEVWRGEVLLVLLHSKHDGSARPLSPTAALTVGVGVRQDPMPGPVLAFVCLGEGRQVLSVLGSTLVLLCLEGERK